jgi:SAM-dependent methyltransferase
LEASDSQSPDLKAQAQYYAAAMALKLLSSSEVTRRGYRLAGNKLGRRIHGTLTPGQIDYGLWQVQAIEDHSNPLQEDSVILELGTGWIHFYGLFLTLFLDARLKAVDIADIRQLAPLRMRFAALADGLTSRASGWPAQRLREAQARARRLACAQSFEEVYESARAQYMVVQDATLAGLSDASVDVVSSVDVLEHIRRSAVGTTAREIRRILRPGGISVHQIGTVDHIAHYSPKMPSKYYLKFSDRTWATFLENRLQYVNRLQASEFLGAFAGAGLELVHYGRELDQGLPGTVRLAPQFRQFEPEDLMTTRAYMVHRRPHMGSVASASASADPGAGSHP